MTMTTCEKKLSDLARTALEHAPKAPQRPRLLGPADTASDQVLRAGRAAYLQGCLGAILGLAAAWYHAGEAPELRQMLEVIAGEPGGEEGEVVIPDPETVKERAREREDAERLLRVMAGLER